MTKFDELFENIRLTIVSAQEDAEKFSKGNSSAGTRLRKKMQEVKKLAQEIRENVSDVKNMK